MREVRRQRDQHELPRAGMLAGELQLCGVQPQLIQPPPRRAPALRLYVLPLRLDARLAAGREGGGVVDTGHTPGFDCEVGHTAPDVRGGRQQ